jgi:chondroitin AC lyase
VTTSAGTIGAGKHSLKAGDWVHHAGMGYHLVQGEKPELQIAEQKGDWKDLFTTRGSSPQSGQVFSLWLDHGTAPKEQSYAYVMYPETSATDMPRRVQDAGLRILSNTPELQAVSVKGETRIQAVFFTAGKLEWSKGKELESDTPCVVSVVRSAQGAIAYVSEPTQQAKTLHLKWAGRAVTIELPIGGNAGKAVEVKLGAP